MSKNRVMEAKNAKARKMIREERALRRDVRVITNTLLGEPVPAPSPVGVCAYAQFARAKDERKQSVYDKMLATNKVVVRMVKA